MEEEIEMEDEIVVVTDEAGRTLSCTIERHLEIEGQNYALLLPVDYPVEILTWEEEDDDEEAISVENDEDIDELFPSAKAVLEEQNLTLKRSAVFLTVEGELPDVEEDDDGEFIEFAPEDGEVEELQYLASFFYDDQEFAVYAPLAPYPILVRMDDNQQPHLLSAEEMDQLEPMLAMLEEQLLDEEFEAD